MRVSTLILIGFMCISSDSLGSTVACRDDISSGGGSYGPPFKVTHSFSNNSLANADEVNQNFTDIVEGINSRLMVDLDFPQNVALGFNALSSVNDSIFPGTENTAIGYLALSKTIDGYHNTAIGYEALCNNLGGIHNTAVGSFALHQANSVYNTAVGWGALRNTTSGEANTGLGHGALESNTTGIFNSAVGTALNKNVTGNSNTATGAGALSENVSGDGNTAFGSSALSSNQSGDNNTAIGYFSDVRRGTWSSEDPSNSTAIGANAIVTSSNTIQLGNSEISSVRTSGSLSTGQVTYPNFAGTPGAVLGYNENGQLTWLSLIDVEYTAANLPDPEPTPNCGGDACPESDPEPDPTPSGCTGDCVGQSFSELEAQIASLQEQIQSQQEQIAQLQGMVEHQFAVR